MINEAVMFSSSCLLEKKKKKQQQLWEDAGPTFLLKVRADRHLLSDRGYYQEEALLAPAPSSCSIYTIAYWEESWWTSENEKWGFQGLVKRFVCYFRSNGECFGLLSVFASLRAFVQPWIGLEMQSERSVIAVRFSTTRSLKSGGGLWILEVVKRSQSIITICFCMKRLFCSSL